MQSLKFRLFILLFSLHVGIPNTRIRPVAARPRLGNTSSRERSVFGTHPQGLDL